MTAACTVYVHKNAVGDVLYVGQTNDLSARQRAHAATSAWWPRVAHTDTEGPFSREEALRREAALIAAHDPQHNKMGTSRQVEVYEQAWATRRERAGQPVDLTTFAQRVAAAVRAEAARRGLSQVSLARALGYSQSSFNRRITGEQPFDVDELYRVADYLGVPVASLAAA